MSPPRSRYVFTSARRDLYLNLIITPLRNSNLIIRAKSNKSTSQKTSRRAMFSDSGHSLLVHGATRQALKSIRLGRIQDIKSNTKRTFRTVNETLIDNPTNSEIYYGVTRQHGIHCEALRAIYTQQELTWNLAL